MSNPYIVTYTGDGSQTDFQAPATYIRRAHVTVSVGGVITTAYVWHTDTIIRFNVAPGNGVVIEMTDQAPSGPLNVFSGDTGLSALALNENFKQAVQVGDFAFNAAKDIVGGAIPPNTITGAMLADGAVTAAKTSAGVQASLGLADTAVQPANAGRIIQVIEATTTTYTVVSGTTLADAGLSATITPKATSSKILVVADINYWHGRDIVSSGGRLVLVRGTTVITPAGLFEIDVAASGSGTTSWFVSGRQTMFKLDSPNTTNAVTYKVQMSAKAATNNAYIAISGDGNMSKLYLLEVLA